MPIDSGFKKVEEGKQLRNNIPWTYSSGHEMVSWGGNREIVEKRL